MQTSTQVNSGFESWGVEVLLPLSPSKEREGIMNVGSEGEERDEKEQK